MKAIPLKDLLEKANLTQVALAKRLGIRQPSVSDWGRNGIPLKRLDEISAATGIPVLELLNTEPSDRAA